MKKILVGCAIVLAATIGCQTSGHSPKPAERTTPQKNPQADMTMEQIVALYGKPDSKQFTSEGEVWVYHLKPGQALIPWNWSVGRNPKVRTIYFGKDGKVNSWSYSQ